ncbi:mannosyltransferase family protein [Archangium lansingense]|uniref:Mannosyltransferase family protein n=1 Tax=Archangium lansingense TaxID=2995310 RepID=A0ABT3ZYS8_9BACT|nr:mannosyltransferase family protein [Archangium lansinium]MCY1074562.1 mannosyltransferase family protein [Archangium lansinium]
MLPVPPVKLGWTRTLALAVAVTVLTWSLATAGRLYFRQYSTSGAEGIWPTLYPLHALIHWDSGWYEVIATSGYSYTPGEQSPVVFFPGYPMAVRGVSWLLGVHPFLAGVMVSTLCGLLVLPLFFAWARRVGGERVAWLATLLLAAYPYAFYLFGVMYSEPFFLLLVVGSFLCLERDVLWGAALLGALATATRPVAPAILVGLVVRQWERRRQQGESPRRSDAILLLSGAGMAGFMLFQWLSFGEPLGFAKAQAAPGWDHVPGWDTWLKMGFFRVMASSIIFARKAQFALHALLTFGALALAWPMRRHLGWGYSVYVVMVLAIPALNMKDFWGMGRYVLAAYPCFLELAVLLENRPRVRAAALLASLSLFCTLALAFGRGAWVA